MSWVNNCILTFMETHPSSRIAELNGHLGELAETHQGFPLGEPESGGSKALEADIRLAAFNHVESFEVIEAIRLTEWGSPESVRLFWCGQEDEFFVQVYP